MKVSKNLAYLGLILVVSVLMFYKPLFSGVPLGLDALGHLSKVSYIKEYPFASWDIGWYSGAPFLKLYSPLLYYLTAIFPNPIFGMNLLSFLSIFFTSVGVFLLVKYHSKNPEAALFSGLGFLSVLSISYYYISVGNHPWVTSLWSIPFAIYFLERSIAEKLKRFFVLYTTFFVIGILIHVLAGGIIGVLMLTRFFSESFNLNIIKKILLYGGIPVLISSFWLLPFLSYHNNYFEGGLEVPPKPLQILGFDLTVTWGYYSAGIGVLFFLFLLSLFSLKRNKIMIFYLTSSIILGFIFFGGLRTLYPYGVEPVRFVLPFSILISIFSGISFGKAKKNLYYFLFGIIAIGLIWNLYFINENFERFGYYGRDSRYGIIKDVSSQKDFPIKNEFTNYRLGTYKYIFGEPLNYFYPSASQTLGYQDAGMLNPPRFYDMRWNIWTSENINDSIYWLDWFGIKYIAVDSDDNKSKFENDDRFFVKMNYSSPSYSFTLFEYKNAKKIITLVDSYNGTHIGEEKNCFVERNNPDKAVINFDEYDNDDVVVFKEFYDKSWTARDAKTLEKLDLLESSTGFMAVYPKSTGIVFVQEKGFYELSGIILSIIGLLLLLIFSRLKSS